MALFLQSGPLAMPSYSHIAPKILNTHVLDTWLTVAQSPPVRFRRATLMRAVITICVGECGAASCLHIRPMCGGFVFANSDEFYSDGKLEWSEPAPWATLSRVLEEFSQARRRRQEGREFWLAPIQESSARRTAPSVVESE